MIYYLSNKYEQKQEKTKKIKKFDFIGNKKSHLSVALI